MKPKYLDAGAEFSECGRYRYWLSRRLAMGERIVLFVGLNPSTATAAQDDPTIRRCVGYARAWGFDWLYMGNLHGWRSTDPKALLTLEDLEAVGPGNQAALAWLAQRSELVIAAWGSHPLNAYARTFTEVTRIEFTYAICVSCGMDLPERGLCGECGCEDDSALW